MKRPTEIILEIISNPFIVMLSEKNPILSNVLIFSLVFMGLAGDFIMSQSPVGFLFGWFASYEEHRISEDEMMEACRNPEHFNRHFEQSAPRGTTKENYDIEGASIEYMGYELRHVWPSFRWRCKYPDNIPGVTLPYLAPIDLTEFCRSKHGELDVAAPKNYRAKTFYCVKS